MRSISLLLVSCALSAVASSLEEPDQLISKEAFMDTGKVLTTSGEECKFPFRQGGRLHHHCITILSSRPWCSLTHNFDRDRKFGFCAPQEDLPDVLVHSSRRVTDPCHVNPCENGGVCTPIPRSRSIECTCTPSFSGRLCEKKKCYETAHLHFYDTGESWGRIHLRNVEQCTCVSGESECERVQYTKCQRNPCRNEASCRLIVSTGKEVCYCRRGYSGPYCSFEPETECYTSRGTDYRGVVDTTESGAQCLPWNSDLLFDELHVGTVNSSLMRGLGDHGYCRNPDGDRKPWCYVLNDGAISWEYCDVPSCVMPVSSSRRFVVFNKPARRKPKGPVCGTKHKKRLSGPRGRILGGNSALPGTHPWMAAIYIKETDFCSGSLISNCWIISAAHCFLRSPLKSQIRVVLGQHRFNVSDHNTRTFGVEDYFLYTKFSVFNPILHDIVLIKLKKQDGRCVKKSPFIRPICLPDKSMKFPDGFCCSISGWGHMSDKAKGYSSLQEGGVRLVNHDHCRKPEVYGNHVSKDMICAGLNGCVDACQGDSGGPLACPKDDVNFLYGIISWGDGCGQPGKPGVYTKVVNYIDWINSKIRRKPKA
ncbi:hepatocyte growth factor activator isoform X2 [Gouania willdenowi]|uniref:trypsin n=1 Tax=Gouania willdenowi TaxID=441366 RepID=A0A8C5GQ73_GOUWI|nr:hepatocyte growth factor activator isoform X2 [Gouania willdenowi]